MANTCTTCGKGLPGVKFIESDDEVTLNCDCSPQPDALTLILNEMRAIRALLERSEEARSDARLALISEGQAIFPKPEVARAVYDSATGFMRPASAGEAASAPEQGAQAPSAALPATPDTSAPDRLCHQGARA